MYVTSLKFTFLFISSVNNRKSDDGSDHNHAAEDDVHGDSSDGSVVSLNE